MALVTRTRPDLVYNLSFDRRPICFAGQSGVQTWRFAQETARTATTQTLVTGTPGPYSKARAKPESPRALQRRIPP